MKALTLFTTYPCCGRASRLRALEMVPREKYDRACRRCEILWAVTRTIVAAKGGVRVDMLVWES